MDERIPFISKLRRVTNSIYTTNDIRKAEINIYMIFNWCVQTCTLIDIL